LDDRLLERLSPQFFAQFDSTSCSHDDQQWLADLRVVNNKVQPLRELIAMTF